MEAGAAEIIARKRFWIGSSELKSQFISQSISHKKLSDLSKVMPQIDAEFTSESIFNNIHPHTPIY